MNDTQTTPIEAAHDGSDSSASRLPVLIIAAGRQRVGKTALLNALLEVYRSFGAEIDVLDADLHNRTNTLSLLHPDARHPPAFLSPNDQKTWMETEIQALLVHRHDAVLDVGGGMTAFNTLIEEIHLVDLLEKLGYRVVLMYVLGTDPADLDYLQRFAEGGMFLPKSMLLVFNTGLVMNGRSIQLAFEPMLQHPTVLRAIEAGAEVVQMPVLGCMEQVNERNLSLADFADGRQVDGHLRTSFFDQHRVRFWLERSMPEFFREIPEAWMPRTSRPVVATL